MPDESAKDAALQAKTYRGGDYIDHLFLLPFLPTALRPAAPSLSGSNLASAPPLY